MSGPQVLRTTRLLAKETIQVSAFLELDGQGMPSYATPVDVEANVVFQAPGTGVDFVITASGSKLYAPLMVYVEGDAPYLPLEQDMIEVGSQDQRTWIVAERKEPRGLRMQRDQLDHVRLQCRVQ